jgi:hypothetical protein
MPWPYYWRSAVGLLPGSAICARNSYSEESVAELQTKAASEMARILCGEEPINLVYRRQFEATTA